VIREEAAWPATEYSRVTCDTKASRLIDARRITCSASDAFSHGLVELCATPARPLKRSHPPFERLAAI
jgi:hypothetical protein